ncbi:MAG: Uma2 family endonuclease [Bryobacteraceae bacterium]|nr:Uma2 family endonuclease [Bryobacteraceae bacterium]
MSHSPRRMLWSEAEYLAFESDSPTKHEFFSGEVFAMAGASPQHNLLAGNAALAIGMLVRGRGCKTFNSDQRIYIPATGLYTYADGGVACGKWEIHTDGMCLLNPVLLFEILSPSTRDYDRGAKREHYQQIPTLRHLLLIDQSQRHVRHDFRGPEGAWEVREFTGGAVRLADFPGELALDDLYGLDE